MAILPNNAMITNSNCNCICNQCNCNSIIGELHQQIEQLKASNKSSGLKYVELLEMHQNLEQEYQKLLDLQDYNQGPYQPSSQQSLQQKYQKTRFQTETKEESKTTTGKTGEPDPIKKKGRVQGHKGTTKQLTPNCDVHDYVLSCRNCGNQLDSSNQKGTGAYFQVEIPNIMPVTITQHYTYRAICTGCDTVSRSTGNLKGTVFGPNAVSFLTDLWYTGVIPLAKVAEIFGNHTREVFSASTIDKAIKVAAEAVRPEVEKFKAEIRANRHPHLDETSYTLITDNRCLCWIFVVGTKDAVFFEFREDRKAKFLVDFFDDLDNVIPVIDGWQSYNFFENWQRCWSHILIESKNLADLCDDAKIVDMLLRNLFNDLQTIKEMKNGRNEGIKKHGEKRLNKIIERLKDAKHEKLRKFHRKLVRAQPYLLTALIYPDLELENNLAERLLRHLVLMRKTRGKVASWNGAEALVLLASFFETCKLKKINPRERLIELLRKKMNG